ncbi:MAG: LysM peptidoglycan-binding domain-containing protein [Elusimicrobia bacterium]|nr:LysM peptidoglycan-binding domain-containing protein [Elusimicrobiota bacterium]
MKSKSSRFSFLDFRYYIRHSWLVLHFIFYILYFTCLYAAFEDISPGVRAAAMGGAYTAISNDSNAIFYNPAGLYLAKSNEFMASYGRLYMGLDDDSSISDSVVSYINPFGKYGTAGIGMHSLSLSGLYSEKKILFSYGLRVVPKLGIGLTMKSLSQKYGSDKYTEDAIDNEGNSLGVADPVFSQGKEKSKLSMDFGILYRPAAKYNLGIVVQDLSSPDLALSTGTVDKVEKTIRVGFAYMPKMSNMLLEIVSKSGNINCAAGFEKHFKKESFALRGGLIFGSNDMRRLNFGLGIKQKNYKIDYAFLFPLVGIDDSSGIHKIAFSVLFGPVPKLEQLVEEFPQEEEDEVLQGPIKEVVTGDVKRAAQFLMKNVQDAYRKGMYSKALENVDRTLDFNPKHQRANSLKEKLDPIVEIIKEQTGKTKIAKLTRKGITAYLEDNAVLAVNAVRYATELAPGDEALQQIFEVIAKKFPEVASKEESIPGLTIVNKKLQQVLESIYDGQYVKAIAECNAILELEEDNITALLRAGSAYWAIGDFTKAKIMWKRVLKYDPDNEEVKEFLDEKTTAPKVEKVKGKSMVRKYIVQKGDTPQEISKKFYGDNKSWGKIYEVNKDKLKNRWSLTVGQELVIP